MDKTNLFEKGTEDVLLQDEIDFKTLSIKVCFYLLADFTQTQKISTSVKGSEIARLSKYWMFWV